MSVNYRSLVWQFRRLEMLQRVIGGQIVSSAGLQRGRLPILEYVYYHPGVSQRTIAQVLHVSPASVAVTVRRMEGDGLLRREGDDRDHRINRIYATPEGEAKTLECRRAFDATDMRTFVGFSQEELALLSAMCERMFENLSGEDYPDPPFFPAWMLTENIINHEEDPNA